MRALAAPRQWGGGLQLPSALMCRKPWRKLGSPLTHNSDYLDTFPALCNLSLAPTIPVASPQEVPMTQSLNDRDPVTFREMLFANSSMVSTRLHCQGPCCRPQARGEGRGDPGQEPEVGEVYLSHVPRKLKNPDGHRRGDGHHRVV